MSPHWKPLATATLAAATALLACSCKDDATRPGEANKPPPPGARNDGPVVLEVDYKNLGYEDGIILENGEPFTGRAVMHHPDGTLKSRYNYIDGLYEGLIEEWYENGQRSAMKHFKAGKQHGITNYWDEKGTPTKMVLYEDDVEVEVKTGDEIPTNLGL